MQQKGPQEMTSLQFFKKRRANKDNCLSEFTFYCPEREINFHKIVHQTTNSTNTIMTYSDRQQYTLTSSKALFSNSALLRLSAGYPDPNPNLSLRGVKECVGV